MADQKSTGFLDRALRNLRGAWGKIAKPHDDISLGDLSPDLDESDAQRLKDQMQACLDAYGGEVSARARAAALGHAFLALNDVGRLKFLKLLTDGFGSDPAAVEQAIDGVLSAKDLVGRRAAERRLRQALEPPRTRLLMQFNALPDGVKFLVDMRDEILGLAQDNPELRGLESDLKALLASWFDIGFLELRQITWDASASLLEKLIAYEAVHEIDGWDDLKNRLAADRRCFAYFHPRMPNEPLIFVWVALVEGIAAEVHGLLDYTAPEYEAEQADAAIFYSISNAQPGLRGISFGDFLIKRVVDSLSAELPNLKTFATLSPIPGFRGWLMDHLDSGEATFSEAEAAALVPFCGENTEPAAAVKKLLAQPQWTEHDAVRAALEAPITRFCTAYLLTGRRPSGTALDSVAHFHLSNGAQIEQLNWFADTSAKGLDQSLGLMVNYLYEQATIETNHEAYTGQGEVMASNAAKNLLKPPR